MAMRSAALSLFLYSFWDDCQLKILKSSLNSDKMLFANYQLYCIIYSISPLGQSQSFICYNIEKMQQSVNNLESGAAMLIISLRKRGKLFYLISEQTLNHQAFGEKGPIFYSHKPHLSLHCETLTGGRFLVTLRRHRLPVHCYALERKPNLCIK